jgi:hypothetical protein
MALRVRVAAMRMKTTLIAICTLIWLGACGRSSGASTETDAEPGTETDAVAETSTRDVSRLPTEVLRDRIAGGWVGQMIGVSAAGLTEFMFLEKTIPEDKVPPWKDAWFTQTAAAQDDVYVEVPFLDALRTRGVAAGWDAYGEAFAATQFPLWHANEAGRDNLQAGIPAPASGHWRHNPHADDIDWQIEADYLGLISPGQPRVAAEMAWRAGHVMNYGDGVYGGVFVATMLAEAFVAEDLGQVVEAGMQALPQGSQYRRVMEDVIHWHELHPDDWTVTWQMLQDKWGSVDRCPAGYQQPYNIDAKLNGAYVLIGLLYGGGDFEASMYTAMRCGQDSDCNPATVAGILGALHGLSGIPPKYLAPLDWDATFMFTQYSVRQAVDATEEVARSVLALTGGRVEGEGAAEEWVIPRAEVAPLILEQWPLVDNDEPVVTAEVFSVDGRTVTLQAQAADDDGVTAFQWSLGDLQYADGTSVMHTYTTPGTYTAIAWATDVTGSTGWASVTVTVE